MFGIDVHCHSTSAGLFASHRGYGTATVTYLTCTVNDRNQCSKRNRHSSLSLPSLPDRNKATICLWRIARPARTSPAELMAFVDSTPSPLGCKKIRFHFIMIQSSTHSIRFIRVYCYRHSSFQALRQLSIRHDDDPWRGRAYSRWRYRYFCTGQCYKGMETGY